MNKKYLLYINLIIIIIGIGLKEMEEKNVSGETVYTIDGFLYI